ncbi:MAG: NAD(P)/FAD-dependent oxidoreductase [Bacteroidales bacterium]|nr:NAD(P)/FAD-dependent oxidoreductase [Bacteroidales bacterium]
MNIAVIGAGAAGLFFTKQLSPFPQFHITLFEKGKKIGTKIKASCGGKANILNSQIDENCYNHKEVVNTLLKDITPNTLRQEFSKMGLRMIEDNEHRIYPSTLFSQTIIDVLTEDLSPNITFKLEYPVNEIIPAGTKWKIPGCDTTFDKIILSIGSPASLIASNRKDFSLLTNHLQLKQKEFRPSLVGFKLKNYPKELFGCRTHAIVSLLQNGKLIHKEKGEVVFKEDGISGIVILNCSAYYNRLPDKRNCTLSLNFSYEDENYDIDAHLRQFHSLSGLLHTKLCNLYKKHPFDVKNLKFDIDKTYDMEFAQVCNGGVCLSEIDENFELKKYKGLFALGEMLDVDGICGGFNLYFAFASAYKLARYLKNEN